jgi:hypothetical protein
VIDGRHSSLFGPVSAHVNNSFRKFAAMFRPAPGALAQPRQAFHQARATYTVQLRRTEHPWTPELAHMFRDFELWPRAPAQATMTR